VRLAAPAVAAQIERDRAKARGERVEHTRAHEVAFGAAGERMQQDDRLAVPRLEVVKRDARRIEEAVAPSRRSTSSQGLPRYAFE
jgi:hypothetical protein